MRPPKPKTEKDDPSKSNMFDRPNKTFAFHLDRIPTYKIPSPTSGRRCLRGSLGSLLRSRLFGILVLILLVCTVISLSASGRRKGSKLTSSEVSALGGGGCCKEWNEEKFVTEHLMKYLNAKKDGMEHGKILKSLFDVRGVEIRERLSWVDRLLAVV